MAKTLDLDPNAIIAGNVFPGQNGAIGSWPDQSGGAALSCTGLSFRHEFRQARAGSTGRATRSGVAIGSRTGWTVTAHLSCPFGLRRGVILSEDDGAGHRQELGWDSLGRPYFAVERPGLPRVVSTAPKSFAPRLAVVTVAGPFRAYIQEGNSSLENMPNGPAQNPDVFRNRYNFTFSEEHPWIKGDEVRLQGFGPLDGTATVTDFTRTTIDVILDRELATDYDPPTTVGGRQIPGSSASNLDGAIDRVFDQEWQGGSWSLAGWLRKTAATQDAVAGGAGIFCGWAIGDARARADRIQIGHDGGGSPGNYRASLGDGSLGINAGPADLDTWRHVAFVYDDTAKTIAAYYDGVLVGTLDVSGTAGAASVFSGLGFGFNRPHTGRLPVVVDQWGVWLGRALSGADVAALFNGGSGANHAALSTGLKAGMTAWYDFDERGGDAIDASGNGNHLVVAGSGSFVAAAGVGAGVPWASTTEAGHVRGTGRRSINVAVSHGEDTSFSWARRGLVVSRDGGSITWQAGGEDLGVSSIPDDVVGPSAGTTAVLSPGDRALAVRASLYRITVDDEATPRPEALAASVSASVLVSRTVRSVPLGVQVDLTECVPGGIHRSEVQDCVYESEFRLAATGELNRPDYVMPTGRPHARPKGFFVSQVFRDPGTYELRVSIARGPFDRDGNPRTAAPLFDRVVATFVAQPKTVDRLIYWDNANGNDANNGLTPETAVRTWTRVNQLTGQSRTRILMRRGTSANFGASPVTFDSRPTIFTLDSYGEGNKPFFIPGILVRNSYDVAIMDFEFRPTNDEQNCLNFDNGTLGITITGTDVRPNGGNSGQVLNLVNAGHGIIVDDALVTAGGYVFFSDGTSRMSFTGVTWDGSNRNAGTVGAPYFHGMRLMKFSHLEIRGFDYIAGVPLDPPDSGLPYLEPHMGSWRGETWWVNITGGNWPLGFSSANAFDGDAANITSYAAAVNAGRHHGCVGVLVEDNILSGELHHFRGGSQVTVRGNAIAPGITSGSTVTTLQFSRGDNVRTQALPVVRWYGNRASSGYQGVTLNNVQMPTPIVPAISPSDRAHLVADGTGVLAPAAIGRTAVGAGVAYLEADGPAAGPNTVAPQHRLMVRVAGSGGAFAEARPLAIGNAFFYSPPSSGSYEFRLDAIDVLTGTVAAGTATTTLEVAMSEAAATYTLDGPEFVKRGKVSGLFTVTLGPGEVAAPIQVVPDDGAATGSFTPASVSLTGETRSATFRYTAAADAAGTVTVATTNDSGLADPASLTISVLDPIAIDGAGATVELTVPQPTGGDGGPYAFQWEVDDGSGWSAVSGATSRTLVVPVPSEGGPVRYRLEVTDGSGQYDYSPEYTIQPRAFRVAAFSRFPM